MYILDYINTNTRYSRGIIYKCLNILGDKHLEDRYVGVQHTMLPKHKLWLGIWDILGTFCGLWMVDIVTGEFHTCLLPHVAGQGRAIAEAGLAKMFMHTKELHTYAPDYNRAAVSLARRLRFRQTRTDDVMYYGGVAFPVHRFTMTKEEYNARSTTARHGCYSRRHSVQHAERTQPEEGS